MELITVIINVYNGEKYIKKCLDSIISQTYKFLEILIINDGSTDNTLSICESYNDSRIKIITTENLGLSLSRNIGIENARGEYFYFIDADDFIESDTIEYLYNLLKKYKVDMATCKSIGIYDYNFQVKKDSEKIDVISNKEMLKKILLYIDNALTIWNKLMKRDLFDEIRFENRIINDLVVTYQIAIKCDKIVYTNQTKYFYFRNDDSITMRKKHDLNRCIDIYKASLERYNNIKKIYPDLIENDIAMIKTIIMLYSRQNKELYEFLKSQKVEDIFNKLFSYKMLNFKIRKNDKLKFLLFKINPRLYKIIIDFYLKRFNTLELI